MRSQELPAQNGDLNLCFQSLLKNGYIGNACIFCKLFLKTITIILFNSPIKRFMKIHLSIWMSRIILLVKCWASFLKQMSYVISFSFSLSLAFPHSSVCTLAARKFIFKLHVPLSVLFLTCALWYSLLTSALFGLCPYEMFLVALVQTELLLWTIGIVLKTDRS